MPTTHLNRRHMLAYLALAGMGGSAWAQDKFPSKPINFILPFPAGGATDVQMRALAQSASKILGQQIVFINRPGNGGTLGPASMAQSSPPDGYNISVIVATLFRLPHMLKVNYDPVQDFSYIINLTGYTTGVVVKKDAPWKSLKDLIEDARKRPGEISIGSTGRGSGGHIAMERLAKMAGVKFNFIPFKGGQEATTALLGGHLDVIADPGWGPIVESGRARALAIMNTERLPKLKDVPTLKELGYDIVVDSPIGLAGPKNMPAPIVKALHDAFRQAMQEEPFLKALEMNDQVPIYMGSGEYTDYVKKQTVLEKGFVDSLNLAALD
ncbi:MAG: tripartite tricarboxylate transporter substrate binding protein [Comamonas sp.]|nr:tripartite tricarboxylate transporter substrate binding protein [Candidatus Comamonas equi]